MEKSCTKCGVSFPATAEYFYRYKEGRFGLKAQCKSCRQEYDHEYRTTDGYRENHRLRWHLNYPVYRFRHLESSARYRARQYGNNTARPDYESIWKNSAGICGICGQEINPNDLSFDHVIPLADGGSHADYNVQVTHLKCNQSKAGLHR